MSARTARGRYIVIEGDEGAGKTTQTDRLTNALQARGIRAKNIREPGGDPFGEELRKILKHAQYQIPPIAETLAFSAARASMLQNVVRPLIDSGVCVITDRNYITTLTIQGAGHGLDSPEFRQVVAYGARVVPPDLTIILDISYEEAEKRQLQRNLPADRFDLGPKLRRTINQAYLDLKESRLVHIDALGSQNEVAEHVLDALQVNGLLGTANNKLIA